MSVPASAVAVQMLSSSSPATQVVSRGGSVDNEKVECLTQLVGNLDSLYLQNRIINRNKKRGIYCVSATWVSFEIFFSYSYCDQSKPN